MTVLQLVTLTMWQAGMVTPFPHESFPCHSSPIPCRNSFVSISHSSHIPVPQQSCSHVTATHFQYHNCLVPMSQQTHSSTTTVLFPCNKRPIPIPQQSCSHVTTDPFQYHSSLVPMSQQPCYSFGKQAIGFSFLFSEYQGFWTLMRLLYWRGSLKHTGRRTVMPWSSAAMMLCLDPWTPRYGHNPTIYHLVSFPGSLSMQ